MFFLHLPLTLSCRSYFPGKWENLNFTLLDGKFLVSFPKILCKFQKNLFDKFDNYTPTGFRGYVSCLNPVCLWTFPALSRNFFSPKNQALFLLPSILLQERALYDAVEKRSVAVVDGKSKPASQIASQPSKSDQAQTWHSLAAMCTGFKAG